MRLDLYVYKHGLAQSRTEAKAYIEAGCVKVRGNTVIKPSFDVSDNEEIVVENTQKKYVSRGGLKLEAALDLFNVSVKGKMAIDIGASSGGFTDCLLKYGAAHVISVDSGSGQLVNSLRTNPRVTVIENYNARYMVADDLEYEPQIAVMDVSFISATLIMPSIHDVLANNADFICLIKPQFEVGKQNVGKGGIVKDPTVRAKAVAKVIEYAGSIGFEYISHTESPIKGGDGNIEYISHFINRK